MNILETTEKIYQKYILRDMLGYLLPGIIVNIILVCELSYQTSLRILNFGENELFLKYFLFFGVSYVIGLSIQWINGYIMKRIKCSSKKESARDIKKRYERQQKILRSGNSLLINEHERFITLKYITGNNAVALSILMIYLLVKVVSDFKLSLIIIFSLNMIIVVFLYCANCKYTKHQKLWEKIFCIQEKINRS